MARADVVRDCSEGTPASGRHRRPEAGAARDAPILLGALTAEGGGRGRTCAAIPER